jgi:CHAD domain-containing protein
VSALAEAIVTALRETPMQFGEMVDVHREVPWRTFLTAWGEVRDLDVLKRDEIGRYFVAGGPAEAVAAATRAE